MLLGLLPRFRRCGPTAALGSWAAGLFVFWLTNYGLSRQSTQLQTAAPVATSLILFSVIGWLHPEDTPERDALIGLVNEDEDEGEDERADGERRAADAADLRTPAPKTPRRHR